MFKLPYFSAPRDDNQISFYLCEIVHNVEKLEAILARTADLLSAVDLLRYFTWRFLIFASFYELLIIIVC